MEDLLKEDGSRKTHEELNMNWLQLQSLWSSFPQMWIIWLSDDVEGSMRSDLFSELDKVTK